MSFALSFLLFVQPCSASPGTPACKPFKDIYPTGKELCENMWSGAFKYEANVTKVGRRCQRRVL